MSFPAFVDLANICTHIPINGLTALLTVIKVGLTTECYCDRTLLRAMMLQGLIKQNEKGILSEVQRLPKKKLDFSPVSLLKALSNDHVTGIHQKKIHNVLTFCSPNFLLLHALDNRYGLLNVGMA